MTNIKITGRNIIEYDGTDKTGALRELGFDFYPEPDGTIDSSIADLEFLVDIDFIIRHDLMDQATYDKHYKGTVNYNRHYANGKIAFLAGEEENFDYSKSTMLEQWPWYDGYRETEQLYNENKYKISAFQDEIKSVIAKYGLTLKYTDEYSTPYAETPEGYSVELA